MPVSKTRRQPAPLHSPSVFRLFRGAGYGGANARGSQRHTETDFDRLGLSVETRRFLRDRILHQPRGKDLWRSRTRQAYGLDEPALASWPDPDWARKERSRLDDLRFDLLEYMTDLSDRNAGSAKKQIDERMMLDWQQLHPLYIIYIFEAISVYLWHHRWAPERASLEPQFELRFETEIQSALRQLAGKNQTVDRAQRDALARLISRILDIGQSSVSGRF